MRKPRSIASLNPETFPVRRAEQCLAKTRLDEHGICRAGRNLYEHCMIVGAVAEEMIATFPAQLRDSLFLPGSSLLAACHDVGKLSPTFYLRLQLATNAPFTDVENALLRRLGLSQRANEIRDFELRWGGHAGVSAFTLMIMTGDKRLSTIVGQHHGCRVQETMSHTAGTLFGAETWQRERQHLIEKLQSYFGAEWPRDMSQAQQLLLAGLTSVADWIGSGYFFDDPHASWQVLLPAALENAGQIAPRFIPDLTFGDLFHDADGKAYQPNEAQTQLFDAVTGPGVYILEAPMGMGKTEAALFAAYKMLSTGKAKGIYFALPTQLTSDKIHQRFSAFLRTILAEDSPHRQALLLHGKAHLNPAMGEEGKPGGSWFTPPKRGLLAPFAVGTLDQALMAAMNVKHGFVRAFGLAGKVVILDEIHSYDAYTSLIMQNLVNILRDLHCTVIILSATLTQSRRESLLEGGDSEVSKAYPLISAKPRVQTDVNYLPLSPPPTRTVNLCFANDGHAFEEALSHAIRGEQVLWIENTVNEAQTLYKTLASRCTDMGIACGLLHSRFTLSDRTKNETKWVNLFGKDGWRERVNSGRILIGTQVLEQSIDIDADFLITRFAPGDMLMQRLGRLWRHAGTPRPAGAHCEAWILAPDLKTAITDPYQAFGASAWVYAPYLLCRSLEIWQPKKSVLIPTDIRPMLEAIYSEREEKGAMSHWKQELLEGKKTRPVRKGIKELEQRARLTLASDAQTLPESRAQTRYSEQDDRAFLLIQAIESDRQAQLTRLQLLNGEWLSVPWMRNRQPEKSWREQAMRLESELVRVRASKFPQKDEGARLWKQGLEHLFYAGNSNQDESPDVMVAIVEPSGDLRGVDGEFSSTPCRYRYRNDIGLQINKKE